MPQSLKMTLIIPATLSIEIKSVTMGYMVCVKKSSMYKGRQYGTAMT